MATLSQPPAPAFEAPLPVRALPVGALLFVLLALALLPGAVLFLAGLAGAIGAAALVRAWRAAPDAPELRWDTCHLGR